MTNTKRTIVYYIVSICLFRLGGFLADMIYRLPERDHGGTFPEVYYSIIAIITLIVGVIFCVIALTRTLNLASQRSSSPD